MSDLPRLAVADVDRLVALLDEAPLVLSPDRHEEGTNALALAPPARMRTCFGGGDSFRRHCDRALAEGVRYAVHRSEGVARDVDSAADLALVGWAPPLSREGREARESVRRLAARASGGIGSARRA
jgi:2-phospho-L-lactate guanylyltransferase